MNIYYYVFIIMGIIILYGFITYNGFIKLINQVEEAYSTMDIYLKKRWDLLPNLVDVVKGYAKHEKETLSKIVELRNSIKSYDSLDENEKITTNKKINTEVNRLMAIVEDYPELKANSNFLELQKELSNIEDEIAQSRKYYNAVVRNYNNKVATIPSNLIAKLFNFSKKNMYEIKNSEKNDVKVDM